MERQVFPMIGGAPCTREDGPVQGCTLLGKEHDTPFTGGMAASTSQHHTLRGKASPWALHNDVKYGGNDASIPITQYPVKPREIPTRYHTL